MFNPVRFVMNTVSSHPKLTTAAAATAVAVVISNKAALWNEFLSDPDAFDAKYPPAA